MAGKRTDKSPEEAGLERNDANYVPLTPLSFLRRAAAVFPARTAWIHGARRASYADFYERSRRLASALAKRGIGKGDTVAIMSPNTPAMLEAHYGVPMCGAILNALNYRLDAASLAFILDHAGARVLLTDRSFSPVIADALSQANVSPSRHRHRRHTGGGRRSDRGDRVRGAARKTATQTTIGPGPRTSGMRSRSTTPPAPRVVPRASSITTGAPI